MIIHMQVPLLHMFRRGNDRADWPQRPAERNHNPDSDADDAENTNADQQRQNLVYLTQGIVLRHNKRTGKRRIYARNGNRDMYDITLFAEKRILLFPLLLLPLLNGRKNFIIDAAGGKPGSHQR